MNCIKYDNILMRWADIIVRCYLTLFMIALTVGLLSVPGVAIYLVFFCN